MSKTHDYPKGRGRREPLYDLEIPTPTHSERARTLASGELTGTLCTIAREPAGHPYGSFITFAMHEGSPVFLVSHLAEHTRNMLQDERVSLLVSETGLGEPLGRGRVTLVGQAKQVSDDSLEAVRALYLKAHPGASYYVDYRDFSFWSIDVESVRYIGGFGRMSWIEGTDWAGADPDPIAPMAQRIVSHMNDDHVEAMEVICKAFSRAEGFTEVSMTGIDRYGFEMSVKTSEGPRPVRVAFEGAIGTMTEARKGLVALTNAARDKLGAGES